MDLYLLRHEQQTGPHTEAETRALVAAGKVERTCLAWQEGLAEWIPLEQVVALPEIQDLGAFTPTTNGFGRDHLRRSRSVPKISILLTVILLAVCALAYFIKRPDAPLPNRGEFTQALATVHIVSDTGRQIIVGDKWNRKLVLEIRLNEPWESPGYKIVTRGDQLKIDYDNFSNLASAKNTNFEVPPALDRNQQVSLGPPMDSDLPSAINTMVDWSIRAVESKTTEIQRRVSGDDYNGYIFQGVQRANQYILIYSWMPRLSIAEFNSSNGQRQGATYPITDYARAHLWKYLFDHYDEIKSRADSYFAKVNEQSAEAGYVAGLSGAESSSFGTNEKG